MHALLFFPELPSPHLINRGITLRITHLHFSATELTDHTTGLLLFSHLFYILGPLFRNGLIIHCRHSSATRAFLKTHSTSKFHTNPAQLLLQMGYILRSRFANICLTPHTPLTEHTHAIDRAHHLHFPSKASTLTLQADYNNDTSRALVELSMETQLWFLCSADTRQPYLGGLTDVQDKAMLQDYTMRRDQYRRTAGRTTPFLLQGVVGGVSPP